MIYFITENGNGAYVEAQNYDDPMWDPATCIEVPQRPGGGYIWNNTTKVWEITTASQQAYIRPIRNKELYRVDKYVLEDFPVTSEQRDEAHIYRQALRDIPEKATPQEMVMPVCPSFMVN